MRADTQEGGRVAVGDAHDACLPGAQVDLKRQLIVFAVAIEIVGLGRKFQRLERPGVFFQRGRRARGHNRRRRREIRRHPFQRRNRNHDIFRRPGLSARVGNRQFDDFNVRFGVERTPAVPRPTARPPAQRSYGSRRSFLFSVRRFQAVKVGIYFTIRNTLYRRVLLARQTGETACPTFSMVRNLLLNGLRYYEFGAPPAWTDGIRVFLFGRRGAGCRADCGIRREASRHHSVRPGE